MENSHLPSSSPISDNNQPWEALYRLLCLGYQAISVDSLLLEELRSTIQAINASTISDSDLERECRLIAPDVTEWMEAYRANLATSKDVQALFEAANHRTNCCRLIGQILKCRRVVLASALRQHNVLMRGRRHGSENYYYGIRVLGNPLAFP